MKLYTLDRDYNKLNVIEDFYSVIWTERYYGDGECEIVVPLTRDYITQLKEGTLVSIDKSAEPMILENFLIEEGKIKVTGISILSWLNNRFIRNSVNQRRKSMKIANQRPGEILWTIVKQMCTSKSTLIGTNSMGLGSAARERELIIPKLLLDSPDTSGGKIKKTLVPYGPVYDGLRKIAEQHKVGMQITLRDGDKTLRFRSYKGANRTSGQKTSPKNPIVRFSPTMDSLASVSELHSIAEFKTLVYAFAPNIAKVDTSVDTHTADPEDKPDTWPQQDNKPGIARRTTTEGKYTGFDLRAKMIFIDDSTIADNPDDPGPDSPATVRDEMLDILNNRADKELKQNEYIRTVDGEVAQTNLFQYKTHYDLGDIIEVQGNTRQVEYSRVIEYIRTQSSEGEKAYPTVEAVDP